MRKLLYLLPLLIPALTGCLDNESDTDYTEWRQKNDEYVSRMEALTENGQKVYTRIVPSWSPGNFVLVKWHNDRSLTAGNLSPLSNSIVNIKYELEDIDGKKLGDSYSSTSYGDSIYQSRPNQNIVGMWAALTSMHVGDSVTLVIPSGSGYGNSNMGTIPPFSTLIYRVKLKGIPAYEKN